MLALISLTKFCRGNSYKTVCNVQLIVTSKEHWRMNRISVKLKRITAGGILAGALMLALGSSTAPAAFAQEATPGTTTAGATTTTQDNNNDGFPWGVLGLLGLAGLAGLRPQKQEVRHVERTPATRTQ